MEGEAGSLKTGHSKEPYGLGHSQVKEGESESGWGGRRGLCSFEAGEDIPWEASNAAGPGRAGAPHGPVRGLCVPRWSSRKLGSLCPEPPRPGFLVTCVIARDPDSEM